MSALRTRIVSAIIGEGGSGGALALAVADRVLMLDGAIYSVISPEGAAAILYRDPSRAAELSSKLKLTAQELKRLGIVDEIVPEPAGGTGADPEAAAAALSQALVHALADLQRRKVARIVHDRYERYKSVGRRHAKPPRRILRLMRRPRRIPRLPVRLARKDAS
jgi:acetyl-CoA carboxylase alpha subunit